LRKAYSKTAAHEKKGIIEMSGLYRKCTLCPRNCGINRDAGERGFCGETAELRIAAASIHRGEEPPVTGSGGSGTIFVTGCNLGCIFCQNYQISQQAMGRSVSAGEFAQICLALQKRGAENINIVTGSHAIPAIVSGLDAAKAAGLYIPVLWNSSAYESLEALELLSRISTGRDRVDVYLPDLKTLDSSLAARFFNAPDYPETAAAAIKKMIAMRPLCYNDTGTALVSGVIIRHLVLPGFLESTRAALRWFAENARGRALLSLMTQYTPLGAGPERYVNQADHNTVLGWLEEFGLDDGFYQELVTGDGWLPDFNKTNPFPAANGTAALSEPVWHWSGNILL
jgi:putative pyruvate formate lyase activating enzyme